VGSTTVNINKEVLEVMEQYGFKPEHVKHSVEANDHNHTVATYFLMCKKLNSASIHKRLPPKLNDSFSFDSVKHTVSGSLNKTFTSNSPRP